MHLYTPVNLLFALKFSILSLLTLTSSTQAETPVDVLEPNLTLESNSGKSEVIQPIFAGYTAQNPTESIYSCQTSDFPEQQVSNITCGLDQITSVSQLNDVQPTDWAFQALQFLVERYGCIAGYPNNTYRGNQSISRYEFAAGLNACLTRINELMAFNPETFVTKQDLQALYKLQAEFSTELTTLRSRVDTLETRTAQLQVNQFSTTTKLTGQAIFALTGGGFSGERIISPTGRTVATQDPNTTFIYRASVDFNTSFSGTDLLKLRLVTGSDGANDNPAGFLEPNFGSVLDFSVPGRNGRFSIGRLYYAFNPVKDIRVTVGSALVATEYVDRNSYANNSFRDFSTQAFVNSFVLFPRPGGAGAVVEWNPQNFPVKLRALYVSASAARRNEDEQRAIGGPSAPILLFPNRGGKGGLFNDPYQGIVELEYSPSRAFALRLQYAGGEIFQSPFHAVGVNVEAALSPNLGIFGRYGIGTYYDTNQGDLNPNYWMAGVAFPDLFVRGAKSGIAIGQPIIESKIGDATQMNIEAFYNYPVSNNISVTPLVQVIMNPGNQEASGTIVTGTLRTVFSF
jgi:Carbohydrate-selective porin, OprB family/S-layer homology domain